MKEAGGSHSYGARTRTLLPVVGLPLTVDIAVRGNFHRAESLFLDSPPLGLPTTNFALAGHNLHIWCTSAAAEPKLPIVSHRTNQISRGTFYPDR